MDRPAGCEAAAGVGTAGVPGRRKIQILGRSRTPHLGRRAGAPQRALCQCGAEYLRSIPRCVDLVRHFVEANKPIASICRGPSLLLAAGVRGKRMTAIDVIRRDITRSGNTYVEAEG